MTEDAEWLVGLSRSSIDQAAAEVQSIAASRGVVLDLATVGFLADELSKCVMLIARHIAAVDQEDDTYILDDDAVDFCTWMSVVWATLAGDDDLAKRIAARPLE